MTEFDSVTRSVISYAPSYKTVACDEIELNGNADYQQAHHSTWRIKDRTSHNYRVNKKHLWNITWEEVKLVPWKWMIYRFCSHILPIITIIGLIVLLSIMSLPGFLESYAVCKPDGTFSLSYDGYTPWKRDAIFAIDMGFGSFSFGVAKLIDVSWDLVVGRGAQALLCIFAYKTFTKALSRTMESSTVTSRTFKAITLQNGTMFGVLGLIRDFAKTSGTRAKVAMFWTILPALFVPLVPIWLSALTGYIADVEGFVKDINNNLVPVEDFLPAIYTIHDGDRLGDPYTKDYRVVIPWVPSFSLSDSNTYNCLQGYARNYTSPTKEYYWRNGIDENCILLWRVSEYTSTYGMLGLNATETKFTFPNETNVTIREPALNISANFASSPHPYQSYATPDRYARTYKWYERPFGIDWKVNGTTPFVEAGPLFYHHTSSTAYNLTQLNENGSCQQQNNVRYKWGFSFLLLYVFLVAWLVWTIVMYGLYLDAHLHSRLDVVKRNMGLERAVLDLSLAMQKKVNVETVELHGNHQLEHLIRSSHMSYQSLLLDLLPPTRWTQVRQWWRDFRFGPWARAERWWLAALLIFNLFFVLSFTIKLFWRGWTPYFSALPGFGVFLVLVVGRNTRCRWLIFAFCFLLFWAGNIWWIDKLPWDQPKGEICYMDQEQLFVCS